MIKSNIKKIIAAYGEQAQKIKALEELAELQTEIARELNGQGAAKKIIEEMADTLVMIHQLQMIYSISNSELADTMDAKIERTLRRIEAAGADRKDCEPFAEGNIK